MIGAYQEKKMFNASRSGRSGGANLRLVIKQQSENGEISIKPPAGKLKESEKREQNKRLKELLILADQGNQDALEILKPEVEAIGYKGAYKKFRNFPFIDREEADSEAYLISIEKADQLLCQPKLGQIARSRKYKNERGNLVSYFFTCGSNKAIDRLRKIRKHYSMEISVDFQEKDPISEVTDAHSWSKTLDGLLAHRLDLDSCIEKLSDAENKLLILRIQDDMAHNDIAKLLKKSKEAVRQSWSRIMGKLRECMGVSTSPAK